MKVGIYSDVHANQSALRAVLSAFEEIPGMDWFVCLGDVVGYGPEPDLCCDLVREHARYSILGNHDAAVCGRMDYTFYYPAAREALDHHSVLLKPENIEWLKELPYIATHQNLCFTHGSPIQSENFDYIFTQEHALGLLDYWDNLSHLTFMGHSHLRKSFEIRREGDESSVVELDSEVLQLDESCKYVMTVGSVGQPRDNDARACFTVLDTEEQTLTYHRVDYDVYDTAEGIWGCDNLAPDFGKRLFLGV